MDCLRGGLLDVNQAAQANEAQALADKAKVLVDKIRDDAYKAGWARGYELGFVAGVQAQQGIAPKVTLTDAV